MSSTIVKHFRDFTWSGQQWVLASRRAQKGELPRAPPSGRPKALGPGVSFRPPVGQTSPSRRPLWPTLASALRSRGGAVLGTAAQLPWCPPSPRLPDLILKLDPRAPGLAVARSPWSPTPGQRDPAWSLGVPRLPKPKPASAARGPGGRQAAGWEQPMVEQGLAGAEEACAGFSPVPPPT